MAEVLFHFNVPDRLPYACRLLRKAHRLGTRVTVLGEPAVLERLDRLLWVAEPMDFVPHIRVGADGAVPDHLLQTPLWLVEQIRHAPADHPVLVQLADDVPGDADRFERIVEVVSTDPDEVQAGRRRWRTHQDAGRTITRHDAAGAAAARGG